MTADLGSKNKTVQVRTGGKPYLMEGLPLDSISKHITQKRFPYEHDFLKRILEIVDTDKYFIDAGAHIGNLSVYLAVMGNMKGMAFEPNPNAIKILNQNLASNDLEAAVAVQNLGLSDTNLVKHFTMSNLRDPSGFSALREPDHNSFTCRTISLDNLFDFFELRPIGYISIDTEGSEVKVISGATQIIERHKPFISTRIFDAQRFDQVTDLLGQGLGYRPIEIFNRRPTLIWAHPAFYSENPDLHGILRHAIRHSK